MALTNSILLALVAVICFLGGMNVMLKGAMSFLPKETPTQLVLDDLVRFLSGIYIGCGFLFAYAAFHLEETTADIVYLLGLIVAFSGLGRLYSRYKVGTAGRYFDFIMSIEIILGLAIICVKWFS